MNKRKDLQLEKYKEMERQIKQWRQDNPKPTLTEIEEAVERELAKVRQATVGALVHGAYEEEKDSYHCPKCQKKMVKNGYKKRILKTKEGQMLTLNRQQVRCLQCGMTLFPPG